MFKILFLIMYLVNMVMACIDQHYGRMNAAIYDMTWSILMYLLYKAEE